MTIAESPIPDFRALCVELVGKLVALNCSYKIPSQSAIIERAFNLLAQSAPVPPTDEELLEYAAKAFCFGGEKILNDDTSPFQVFPCDVLAFARDLLAAQVHPAINPIPFAERLPTEEDCAPWPDEPDLAPWCWVAKYVGGGWEWFQHTMLGLGSNNFKLCRLIACGGWTHWLPHYALPVPPQPKEPQS